MMLSDEQFDEVITYLENSGLRNPDLKKDLLDHVACNIEEYMDNGDDFKMATERTFDQFTRKRIREIEYTTELLTTDHMKKHTKIIGVIGALTTILGVSMKLMHLMGAGITFGVGVLILGLGFFTSNAIDTIPRFDSVKGKVVQIIGALGALITLTGGMFKMLHLPGAGQLIIAGPLLLLGYYSFSSLLRTKVPE